MCKASGLEILLSLLLDVDIRKWFPDELQFMRQSTIRRRLITEDKEPANLGCLQTLITLDGNDCSKKVTTREFARR